MSDLTLNIGQYIDKVCKILDVFDDTDPPDYVLCALVHALISCAIAASKSHAELLNLVMEMHLDAEARLRAAAPTGAAP